MLILLQSDIQVLVLHRPSLHARWLFDCMSCTLEHLTLLLCISLFVKL